MVTGGRHLHTRKVGRCYPAFGTRCLCAGTGTTRSGNNASLIFSCTSAKLNNETFILSDLTDRGVPPVANDLPDLSNLTNLGGSIVAGSR
jgi:hypothetical protein